MTALVAIMGCRCETKQTDQSSHAPVASSKTSSIATAITTAASSSNEPAAPSPCSDDTQCGASERCLVVGQRAEPLCALTQPVDLAVVGTDRDGQQSDHLNPRYLGKLLSLSDARLVSRSRCTMKGCAGSNRCCNGCSEQVFVDSQVFQTDAGRLRPAVEQAGVELFCPGHDECAASTCPRNWRIGEQRQLVGRFLADDRFELWSPLLPPLE